MNSSGPLMRKAVFFVMTVEHVLRLISQSKVCIVEQVTITSVPREDC